MLKLSAGREAFEIEYQGQTTRWEYDVVAMKLQAEELEKLHGMRVKNEKGEDTDVVKRPTLPFLEDFATKLQEHGFASCTTDSAYKVYNVVNIQFAKIAQTLEEQVTQIANG